MSEFQFPVDKDASKIPCGWLNDIRTWAKLLLSKQIIF